MPNYTRIELAGKTATMNQMRNNLYHFLRFLMSRGIGDSDIQQKLQRMGKNIAETIAVEKKFFGSSVEELIENIYTNIFESKIDIKNESHEVIVEDKKCPLCKYKREDLSISPCWVVVSMISKICEKYGHHIERSSVIKSVALGDLSCIHTYQIKEREE
ncbi:MAG: hypothetical protein JW776_03570 [Candidatus Lokiarchaeota archaeon]|nr:hypothetical protein [Candidatus Lokiarchaeota archaeon]